MITIYLAPAFKHIGYNVEIAAVSLTPTRLKEENNWPRSFSGSILPKCKSTFFNSLMKSNNKGFDPGLFNLRISTVKGNIYINECELLDDGSSFSGKQFTYIAKQINTATNLSWQEILDLGQKTHYSTTFRWTDSPNRVSSDGFKTNDSNWKNGLGLL